MHTGWSTCFDNVPVQQRAIFKVPTVQQVIVPNSSFKCNGRIVGITASMVKINDSGNGPYFEVWHPRSPSNSVFDKVGRVQLLESEVVQVGTDSNQYWFLNMSLNRSDMIEFESGDVFGYYQPPDTHYGVGIIRTEGYIAYGNFIVNSSSTFNLNNADLTGSGRQLLMQFSIGTYVYYISNSLKYTYRNPM